MKIEISEEVPLVDGKVDAINVARITGRILSVVHSLGADRLDGSWATTGGGPPGAATMELYWAGSINV